MNDPVSRELENRAQLHLPWQWAFLGALGIHLAVVAALLLTPSHAKRALRLPSVQVRLAALPAPARGPRVLPHPPAATAKAPAPVPTARPAPRRKVESLPSHPLPAKRPAKKAARPQPEEENPPAAPAEAPSSPALAGGQTSPAGGIALGGGAVGGEEPFPFTYYLNRVLAVIESNWFRPAAPPGTRCTVRCVIDRSGRLVEAGLEQESPSPAFDRAALRAVYAAAPFPPLPQGFGGARLTLHLEFGQ
jgi:periplasmic protein TonB